MGAKYPIPVGAPSEAYARTFSEKLRMALTVFVLGQVLTDVKRERVEKYIRASFWGLNIVDEHKVEGLT